MPTEIQIEAKRLLEARLRELEILDTTLKAGAIVAGVFTPYGSLILNGYRIGSKKLRELLGDQYLEELAKAISGERSTLPEVPESDWGGAFLGAC